MTVVATRTGALSAETAGWHTINWDAAHRTVRRLQARLVKAVQAGRGGQGRALHHLLPHVQWQSPVKRGTDNTGSTTPGVDGIIWDTPAKKACAIGERRQRGSRAPTAASTFPRTTARIAAAPCRCLRGTTGQRLALYLLALDPLAETLGDPNS